MRWATILLLSLLCGCVRSINPVLTDEQTTINDDVLGQWTSENGRELAVVQRVEGEKTYSLVHTDDKGRAATFRVRVGKVGDLLIAEFVPTEIPDGGTNDLLRAHLMPVHSFVVIDRLKPEAVFRTLSSDWLKKYLSEHPKDLAVHRVSNDDFIVSAPTADWQAFIVKHWTDDGAASSPGTWYRPGDPTTKPAP